MLSEIFYWIFNMSIVASVTGLMIFLMRRFRKIPKRVICFLWLIPFLRMWFPFGLESRYGLMTLISQFTTKTVVVYELSENAAFSMMNYVMAANSYFPITYKVNLLKDVFKIAGIVWIVIALSLIIALTIIYAITKHEIRDASLLHDNIYLSEKIVSPAVYGIFRPKIILPVSYKDKDLAFVLAHENAHIRRADNLWRLIAFVTACVHWFNPLCWLFLKCFLGDLEQACDENVLSKCKEGSKKEYALALLEYSNCKTVFTSAFGGAKIRTRIDNILSYNKITWLSGIGFAVMISVIAYVLLTNAA